MRLMRLNIWVVRGGYVEMQGRAVMGERKKMGTLGMGRTGMEMTGQFAFCLASAGN